jgi:uroporphyrinogen decarboxylase
MRLIDLVNQTPRRLVAPLMGFPGKQLTNSSIWQNITNDHLQYQTLEALQERFSPDAMFFMMDLAVEAGAIGLPVKFPVDESPTVSDHPVKSREDIDPLRVLDPLYNSRVQTYIATMRRMAANMDTVKGAYITGPFTLAGLMMGASDIALATLMNPDLLHEALEFATEVVIRYAKALVEAGADMIAILEPTATFISPKAFEEFSGAYTRRIIESVDTMWVLHICGNTHHLIDGMCATGAQGLSLDAAVDLPTVAMQVPEDVVIIGNVDPVQVMVNQTPDGVQDAVNELLDKMAPYPNFILSTGCDLPPETPLENIDAFMAAGKHWRPSAAVKYANR